MNKIFHYAKKAWRDPVFSKIIAAVIITLAGGLFLYIKEHIGGKTIKEFIKLFYQNTSTNNTLLSILIVITITAIFSFIKTIFTKSQHINGTSNVINDEEIKEEERLIINYDAKHFFAERLGLAFPGKRGLHWYNNPNEIIKKLEILLRQPLEATNKDEIEKVTYSPIWWFRGRLSMYIDSFKRIGTKTCLLNNIELCIKRIAVNINNNPDYNYIYLECSPQKETGINPRYSNNIIKEDIDLFGFCQEEYALHNNKLITCAEFEDGAYERKGKHILIPTKEGERRIRYLTSFNFIITFHHSKLNIRHDKETEFQELMNDVNYNKKSTEDLFTFFETILKS
ncbi:MAG: hypothetical protein R2800_05250 [Flavipsychrobacter sp.]